MKANPFLVELYLLNLGFVASLSFFFFKRKGTMSLGRFLSLLPFLFCTLYLISLLFGFSIPDETWFALNNRLLEIFSIPFSAASFILTAYALGSHHEPVALCHQKEDQPDHLVTHGAYARIRHPFYTAHLLLLFGVFVFLPNLVTFLIFTHAWIMLNFTAMKEERRFLSSPLAAEYKSYMKHTGRFLPKLSKADHA